MNSCAGLIASAVFLGKRLNTIATIQTASRICAHRLPVIGQMVSRYFASRWVVESKYSFRRAAAVAGKGRGIVGSNRPAAA